MLARTRTLYERITKHSQQVETTGAANPRHGQIGSLLSVLSLWAIIFMSWRPHAPLIGLAWLVMVLWLAYMALRGAMLRQYRATSYDHGWHDGRNEVLASLEEAQRRGLTLEDWLLSEAQRSLLRGGYDEDEVRNMSWLDIKNGDFS